MNVGKEHVGELTVVERGIFQWIRSRYIVYTHILIRSFPWSSQTTGEGEEELQDPEEPRTPGKHSLQNQLSRAHRGSQKLKQ